MKKDRKVIYLVIIGFLIVVIISLCASLIVMKKNIVDNENDMLTNITNSEQENDDDASVDDKTYDCSFTRKYNIVNTLDGYTTDTPWLSYIVIDAFQDHYARTHVVPIELKEELENDKTYEFIYTIKGIGIINDMEDVYDKLVWTTVYENDKEHYANEPELKVTLSIKETDKLGMEQKQEPICGNK